MRAGLCCERRMRGPRHPSAISSSRACFTLQGLACSEGTRSSRRSCKGWWHRMKPVCSHLEQIREVTPSAHGCEECLKLGDTWVHLRICLICGHVGCCDSSKNKHATKHFHATQHPLVQSMEPGEDWLYCYVDDLMLEPERGQPWQGHWRKS